MLFLDKEQHSSGAFGIRMSRDPSLKGVDNAHSPFFAALVLHSLHRLNGMPSVRGIVQKAAGYLLQEREDSGYWRFFGKSSDTAPDVDSTACALAALRLNGIEIDYDSAAGALLKHCDADGMFATWIWEKPNYTDWVVNANTLYFFTLIEKKLPAIEDHLCRVIRSGEFRGGSGYYKSPISGLYYFSKLYAARKIEKFQLVLPDIREYLLSRQKGHGGWGNPLEDIMAVLTLLNIGFRCAAVEKAVDRVRSQQQPDGGWPETAFSYYLGPDGVCFYGSRALTTAMALEMLSHNIARG